MSHLQKKIKSLEADINDKKSEISEERKRDFRIYKSCLYTAYINDLEQNRDAKITDEELSILLTLAKELELSQDNVKLMNYMNPLGMEFFLSP